MAWAFFAVETGCVLVPRFLGLNIGNFRISYRQSRTMLRFCFDPENNVFGFC